MKEKEIQIKVNKVKFKVWYAEDKTHFHYGLYRNNKAILASTTPIKRRLEVLMNIYRDLQEAITTMKFITSQCMTYRKKKLKNL